MSYQDAVPMFFENEWGLTHLEEFTKANYDTHSPRRVPGFQKLAHEAGATCFVKFPGHSADEAAKDIWDFLTRRLSN